MALKKSLFGSFKCFYKSGIISLLKRCLKERILHKWFMLVFGITVIWS